MKTMRILTIILLTLSLAAAARAQTPWPKVVVSPENPRTSDTITLTISATWTTDCVPQGVSSVEIQGRSIHITLNQPMYLLCHPSPTFWLATASVGPLDAGCYDVSVGLSSGPYAGAGMTTFCVGNGGPAPTTATLYTVGSAGIHTVSLDGDVQHLLASHQDSEGLEIRDNRLYVPEKTRGGDLFVYDLAGRYLESIPTPAAAGPYLDFVALPERRFALLDNQSDKAFFIDDSGRLLATTSLLTPADNYLQDLKGIVVGNRLILSHDGNNRVLALDLTTYRLSTFKDLRYLPGLLGDIDYAEGRYYIVVGGRWVYNFTESGTAVLVGGIPEGNATGICVLDDFAYLSVNAANKIYRLDLATGEARVLASDLKYLRDIECVPDTAVCCGLQPGDRVVLLTDMPRDLYGQPAAGLHAGALGTVLCCNSDDLQRPLFVSWDNWRDGTNYDSWCDVPPDFYSPYSGWWVRCADVRLYTDGQTCRADFCQYDWPGAGLSPGTIQAGQYLHLAFGLANCGTADIPAGWKIRYYASKDTTITSRDYFLYETTVNPALEAGTVMSGTEDFRFPSGVPAGPYYIGWILDPDNQICESDEDNNAGYIHGVRLTVGYLPM